MCRQGAYRLYGKDLLALLKVECQLPTRLYSNHVVESLALADLLGA